MYVCIISKPVVVDLQKKVVLIPKDTEEGDMVCCAIEISDELDLLPNETATFSVHVRSEDLNVLGPRLPYVNIIVHADGEEAS